MNNRGIILWEELRVMEQTITAKIKIKPDNQAKLMLEQAMSAYKDACNFVADYVFETHQLKQIPLQNNNQGEQVCSDGVQSITPRCNDSQSSIGKKRSRTSKVRSRATGQLQAHPL